jgi:hypothetical protein
MVCYCCMTSGHFLPCDSWHHQGHSFWVPSSSAILAWLPPYDSLFLGHSRRLLLATLSDAMKKSKRWSICGWTCSQRILFFTRNPGISKGWMMCTENNGDYVQKWQSCTEPICTKLAEKKSNIFEWLIHVSCSQLTELSAPLTDEAGFQQDNNGVFDAWCRRQRFYRMVTGSKTVV